MKRSCFKKLFTVAPSVLIGSAGFIGAAGLLSMSPTTAHGQVKELTTSKSSPKVIPRNTSQEKTIRFNFDKTKWETVITWFADQSKFSFRNLHGFPTGTFTNIDGKPYTVSEALDHLNHMLQIDGYLLVRYHNQLILMDAKKGYESSLIDEVKPEDLANRGKFELLICTFDITGLNPEEVQAQLTSMVDDERGKVTTLGIANSVIVREFGGRLRTIKDRLDNAKKLKERSSKRIVMDHITYDTIMRIARPTFGMAEGEDKLSDSSLVVSPANNDKTLWVSGSREKLDRFMKLVKSMDTKENSVDPGEIAPMRYQSFPLSGDADLIQDILNDRFSGFPNLVQAMKYSEDSELLTVKATEDAIKEIQGMIENVEKNGTMKVIVPTNYKDPEELIELIQASLGLETDVLGGSDSSKGNDPKFVVQGSRSILVIGTPGDVKKVQEVAELLDPAPKSRPGEKKTHLIIPLTDKQINHVEQNMGLIWKANGGGKLRFVMPSDRRDPLSGGTINKSSSFRNPSYDREFGDGAFQRRLNTKKMTDEEMLQMIEQMRRQIDQSKKNKSEMKKEENASGKKSPNQIRTNTRQGNHIFATVRQDDSQREKETNPLEGLNDQEVVIKRTTNGLLVLSKDPEALRKAQRIIDELTLDDDLSVGASDQPITFFLQYRKADELKTEIEEVLQLSGGSGGGGGNPLLEMGKKAMGPLGNLLPTGGGSGSVSSSSDKTEGDVYIHADNFLNALIIDALPADIEKIDYLIALKDRSAPPHDPTVTGENRIIFLKNREVEELKGILDSTFKEYIQTATPTAGGGQQGRANPVQQALRGLQGGKSKKGSAKPKLVISPDPTAKAIIATGPTHLVDQVEKLVRKLDTELEPKYQEVLSLPPGVTAETLQVLLPDAFESATAGTAGSANANKKPTSNRPGSTGNRPTGFPNLRNFGGFNFGNRGGSTRGGSNRGGSNRGGSRGGNTRGGRGGRGR